MNPSQLTVVIVSPERPYPAICQNGVDRCKLQFAPGTPAYRLTIDHPQLGLTSVLYCEECLEALAAASVRFDLSMDSVAREDPGQILRTEVEKIVQTVHNYGIVVDGSTLPPEGLKKWIASQKPMESNLH